MHLDLENLLLPAFSFYFCPLSLLPVVLVWYSRVETYSLLADDFAAAAATATLGK